MPPMKRFRRVPGGADVFPGSGMHMNVPYSESQRPITVLSKSAGRARAGPNRKKRSNNYFSNSFSSTFFFPDRNSCAKNVETAARRDRCDSLRFETPQRHTSGYRRMHMRHLRGR